MMTVHQVSILAGVSVRTLHHYDAIGLLRPTAVSAAGYRLYDEEALERLQLILLYKELDFPLNEIGRILDASDFDRNRALEQQIDLLEQKRQHLENLILFARGIQGIGVRNLNFSAFDTKKMDEYAKQAREQWGSTDAYREYEKKTKGRSREQEKVLDAELMDFFRQLGEMKQLPPDSAAVQTVIGELRDFLNDHYYTVTKEIFTCLGQMYGGGGEMNENIDKAGGEGTGTFAERAICVFCGMKTE